MSQPFALTIHNDPQYGTYLMECVGILDHLELSKCHDKREAMLWLDRYHPHTYFKNGLEEIVLHEHHREKKGENFYGGLERVAIFVPTQRVNKDWDYHGSKYGKTLGGAKRRFPLGMSDKAVAEWQFSVPGLVLAPAWLAECTTLADLIAADEKHNAPCKRCENK